MTRVRICAARPGTIIRHHEFENFPEGTTPHPTALFDYLIVALAALLRPFTGQALDLAGALVSPLLSVALGIFLCLWSQGMRFRRAAIIFFGLSPLLAHAFALGRPDHQSLVLALVTVAWCAEWSLQLQPSRGWSAASGLSWGLALWVSLYEPAVLLLCTMSAVAPSGQRNLFRRDRLWTAVAIFAVLAVAAMVERRLPAFPSDHLEFLRNWSAMIGELRPVPLTSSAWWQWCGLGLLAIPFLFWRRQEEFFLSLVLVATFMLTLWQARWGYFFVILFCLLLPKILGLIRRPGAAWIAFGLSLVPVAAAWETRLSDPGGLRAERRAESVSLRQLSSPIDGPFLASGWFCPAIAYWSSHPGVGGTSHESIAGNVAAAEFFAATDSNRAAEICRTRGLRWVVAYDAERAGAQAASLLGRGLPVRSLALTLDREPSRAPSFLILSSQAPPFKLYRVLNLTEK